MDGMAPGEPEGVPGPEEYMGCMSPLSNTVPQMHPH